MGRSEDAIVALEEGLKFDREAFEFQRTRPDASMSSYLKRQTSTTAEVYQPPLELLINLGIMYRASGRVAQGETAFVSALDSITARVQELHAAVAVGGGTEVGADTSSLLTQQLVRLYQLRSAVYNNRGTLHNHKSL